MKGGADPAAVRAAAMEAAATQKVRKESRGMIHAA